MTFTGGTSRCSGTAQKAAPTQKSLYFHTDLTPCATKENQVSWANDLATLLTERLDLVIFEHDLAGNFTRFAGCKKYWDMDLRIVGRCDSTRWLQRIA